MVVRYRCFIGYSAHACTQFLMWTFLAALFFFYACSRLIKTRQTHQVARKVKQWFALIGTKPNTTDFEDLSIRDCEAFKPVLLDSQHQVIIQSPTAH